MLEKLDSEAIRLNMRAITNRAIVGKLYENHNIECSTQDVSDAINGNKSTPKILEVRAILEKYQ